MHSFASSVLGLGSIAVSLFAHVVVSQQVASDPGVYGPALEAVHYYYDEWPTGMLSQS